LENEVFVSKVSRFQVRVRVRVKKHIFSKKFSSHLKNLVYFCGNFKDTKMEKNFFSNNEFDETIKARPVPADNVCRVTSVRPKNPIVSHPYIKAGTK